MRGLSTASREDASVSMRGETRRPQRNWGRRRDRRRAVLRLAGEISALFRATTLLRARTRRRSSVAAGAGSTAALTDTGGEVAGEWWSEAPRPGSRAAVSATAHSVISGGNCPPWARGQGGASRLRRKFHLVLLLAEVRRGSRNFRVGGSRSGAFRSPLSLAPRPPTAHLAAVRRVESSPVMSAQASLIAGHAPLNGRNPDAAR